jgi:hypothetical protein
MSFRPKASQMARLRNLEKLRLGTQGSLQCDKTNLFDIKLQKSNLLPYGQL